MDQMEQDAIDILEDIRRQKRRNIKPAKEWTAPDLRRKSLVKKRRKKLNNMTDKYHSFILMPPLPVYFGKK